MPIRPHGATVLTTLALVLATVLDVTVGGGPALPLPFAPIALVMVGVGTLTTSFATFGDAR